MDQDYKIEKLKEVIEKEVFVTKEKWDTISSDEARPNWFFDFNRILLSSEKLDLVCDIFWEHFGEKHPFQIGGSESSALPIVTGIVLKALQKGKSLNGFFIRKSRTEKGLFKMVEGRDLSDEKIILVDTVLDQGRSLRQQVEVLEKLGKKVSAIFVILQFRDRAYYEYFRDKGIEIQSLFVLDDFRTSFLTENFREEKQESVLMPFKVKWYFKSDNPDYSFVFPKSAPVIDEENIYFGSDNGIFRAVNQNHSSTVWEHKVSFGSQKKRIFSSPVLCNDLIFFGAGDGNFYALEKKTGKRKWVYMDADWIESSPCVAPEMNTIFVGLEFGLWRKEGGIVALNLESGQKKWEYKMPKMTLSSPAYSKKNNVVVCGCNDFSVYAFDAKKGELLWEFETKGEVKSSFAFSDDFNFVAFGSIDTYVYVLKIETGELIHKIKTGGAIYGTPLIHEGHLFVPSLDKYLYCIDLKTGKILWKFLTGGKLFSSPEVIENKIYIGSNDGKLYELDVRTGKNIGFFQSTECITDKISYNKKRGTIFLSTSANEIYCLIKDDTSLIGQGPV